MIGNDTAHALGLITEELKKLREAVLENRLILDLGENAGCILLLHVVLFHRPHERIHLGAKER